MSCDSCVINPDGSTTVTPPATGSGDMEKVVYDPTLVEADAFAMDNMVEGATTKILTDTERTNLSNQSGINTGDQDVLGYILTTWGANLQTLGRHPAINSPSNSAEITSLGIMASIPVPAAGTIDTLTYYNMSGDNTTEFQIIKNGVVMYTFTCTGPYGVETGINVPTGFAGSVPDNIAIRYSAGTAPGDGLYSMYIN